jgi:hypothetical protein
MTTPHESRLAELAQRVVTIDSEIASLDSQYAELAARFDTGSTETLRRAEQIEVKTTGLRRERALVNAACARIEELQKTELIAAEEQAKRQRLAEARKHADAAMALNVRCDEAMRALADLFAQRSNALHALASSGAVSSVTINKLTNKSAATRAACAARLHQFIALETCAPGSMQPLASSNTVLQVGRAVAETSEPNGDAGIEQRRPLRKSSSNGGDRS